MALQQPGIIQRKQKVTQGKDSGSKTGSLLGAIGGGLLSLIGAAAAPATGGLSLAVIPAAIGAATAGASLGGLVGDVLSPSEQGKVESGGTQFQAALSNAGSGLTKQSARDPQIFEEAIDGLAQLPLNIRQDLVPDLFEGFKMSLRS